jgi:hypothetical protein
MSTSKPACHNTVLIFGTVVLHLIQINHQPDATTFQFIIWRLFTAQHVSGVFQPIIRSSMTAVAASAFTFVSWWQSCYVRGRAGRPDHEHSTTITTIRR